jgi:hypothetical protein
LRDIRVTGFTRAGVRLVSPAGEPGSPVELSKIRVYRGLGAAAEACLEVTGTAERPARNLRVTECRVEGPADSGLLCAGGIDGLEVARCRLLGAKTGVRSVGPGRLRAELRSSTLAKVTNPVGIDAPPLAPGKDDLLVMRANLFVDAKGSPVRWPDKVPPVAELFRGSSDNWCDEDSCEPPTPGVRVQKVPRLTVQTHGDDDKFLRYPANHPLATAGPERKPIGFGPVE